MLAFCRLPGSERDKMAVWRVITLRFIVHLVYALFIELKGPWMRTRDLALFESELLIALDVRAV